MTATVDQPIRTDTLSSPVRRPAPRPIPRRSAARPTPVPGLEPRTARRGGRPIQIATPRLELSDKPAALVLRTARLSGPIFRDDAAEATGLSISTVNRQVGALLKAGLLRERAAVSYTHLTLPTKRIV